MLFGQLLGRRVHLSQHDIEEILHEQSMTSRPFGDAALNLGFCAPEDVLRAWLGQLADEPQQVDLERIGVDSQALYALPPELARRHRALPVRTVDDLLLLAVAEVPTDAARREFEAVTGLRLRFVLVSADKLDRALTRYVPTGPRRTPEAA
jgi:type IV pilus assembly protein PilB